MKYQMKKTMCQNVYEMIREFDMRRVLLVFALISAAFAGESAVSSDGATAFSPAGAWRMIHGSDCASKTGDRVSSPDFDDGEWMPARVPGTVLTTLVVNKRLPDPYYGLNNKRELGLIPDVSVAGRDYYTAWFRTVFRLPEAIAGGEVVWMRPEGINYRSEIWLNGRLVTCTAGMFSRTAVNVTPFVNRTGDNVLAVKVFPVDHPGLYGTKKGVGAPGEWRNGGDGEIGRNVTMLLTSGWDWCFPDSVRDRNTGIWRDITFFTTGTVRLDAPFVKTKLNADFSEATLEIQVDVINATDIGYHAEGELSVEIEGTDIRLKRKIGLTNAQRKTEVFTATLRNPRLWWPRNKGPQNLYTARFAARGGIYDSWAADQLGRKEVSAWGQEHAISCRFGVREAYSDRRGPDGARQFWINGRRIFIRGASWGPEAMLRTDDARMAAEMRLTAESGINMLRLWAGGIPESDLFYRLCDEYGILVWQEFWLTGDTRQPDDKHLYLANVEDTVKRIRMHPSLCHYAAANESTEVAGTRELIERLDGTRSYMTQSECDGVHDGSPYYPVNPMRYYDDTASDRGSRIYGFSSEYGTCALPPAECCRAFMPEELLWPVEKNVEVWKYREGGGFDRLTEYHHAAVNCYGRSETFDDYARKSQAADALGHRALWESWNRVRNTATGVLFWYNNTPIPQLGGHTWDHSLLTTASFFAQKSALEPLHVQYEYLSNVVSVCSDVSAPADLEVRAEVYDFDSRKVWEKTASAKVAGETCVDVFKVPFETFGFAKPHFLKLRLLKNGDEIDGNFYWRSCDAYRGMKTMTGPCTAGFAELANLPRTKLEVTSAAAGRGMSSVTVRNVGDRIAFLVRLAPKDMSSVGVHYSDNWFSLLPGEVRTVTVTHPEREHVWTARAFPE